MSHFVKLVTITNESLTSYLPIFLLITGMDVEVKQEDKCDTSHEKCDINPWDVTDASVYLKYCCPECDYQTKGLSEFGDHALSCHDRASTLFKTEHEVKHEDSEASDNNASDDDYFDPLELVDTKVDPNYSLDCKVITFQVLI